MDDTSLMLYLIRQPPYPTNNAIETLEAALVAAAFDQNIGLLFKDDGVWQLLKNQQGELLGQRTLAKMINGLVEYEIEKLYVCEPSLQIRGIKTAALTVPVAPLSFVEQSELINGARLVVADT